MVIVGRIGRPHGIRGDVTVEVRTDDPQQRFVPGAELLTDPESRGPLTIDTVRYSGPRLLLRFIGVDDRNAAEALRGTLLHLDARELPAPTDDDEFFDHQLIGLTAVDSAGGLLGSVTDVLHTPAAPVLTVTGPGGDDVLVPFVAAIVPDVDLASGRITIDPPDGMFPDIAVAADPPPGP